MPPSKSKRRGARPGMTREESRLLTRTKLLASARHEFSVHGLGGANLRDILDRAGVSPGAFYHHFDDKVDLFLKLLDEGGAALRGLFRESRSASRLSSDPVRQLEEAFLRQLNYYKQRHEIVMILLGERNSNDPRVREFFDRDHEAYVNECKEDFDALVAAGLLPAIDTEWSARLVVSLVTESLVRQLRSPRPDEEWARALAQFIVNALPGMQNVRGTEMRKALR